MAKYQIGAGKETLTPGLFHRRSRPENCADKFDTTIQHHATKLSCL